MKSRRAITCLTYHDIAPRTVAATAQLGATTTPDAFTAQLDFVQRHYTVIGLDRLLADDVPARAALITFDDAYASIARVAAPLLAARGLPSVLFVNPAPVLQACVPLDALASLVVETHGLAALGRAASAQVPPPLSFGAFMDDVVAPLGLEARAEIKAALLRALDVSEAALHARLDLFMSPASLRALPALGMDIANHTRTHVHCGALSRRELEDEIIGARDLIVEATRRPVRAFAFPWGRQRDATPDAMEIIRGSGHVATFLVHGRTNRWPPASDVFYRLLLRNETGAALQMALRLWPHLRDVRARLSRATALMSEPRSKPRPSVAG